MSIFSNRKDQRHEQPEQSPLTPEQRFHRGAVETIITILAEREATTLDLSGWLHVGDVEVNRMLYPHANDLLTPERVAEIMIAVAVNARPKATYELAV